MVSSGANLFDRHLFSERFEQLNENLHSFLSRMSAERIYHSIEQFYQFKIKAMQIEKLLSNGGEEHAEDLFQELEVIWKEIDDGQEESRVVLRRKKSSEIDDEEDQLKLLADQTEEELIEIRIDDAAPRINQKIHLSNSIVNIMRGPFKVLVNGTIHAVENCARDSFVEAHLIEDIERHLSLSNEKNSWKSAFTQITSDWIYQGENVDQGFSSASFWMKNPSAKRILIKNQDLPLCAANEWLAYVLGKQIGLPMNEVQVGIYQKNFVTLHTDVCLEKEQIFTFMDLPKKLKKILITDPLMESMYLFDKIIQNVDRNPRNILITIPHSMNINEQENLNKMKIYLIDHSSSFGMGKLNGISIMASKLHTQHLSIRKFNPTIQAKKFHRFLSKLHVHDRIFIQKTLNRFASIDDQLFTFWIEQIKQLLTDSQYQRILQVLIKQRDIAHQFVIQWGIDTRSPSISTHHESATHF